MRIERVKNFLSQAECDALNTWTDEGVRKRWLDAGISRGDTSYSRRVTSRLYADRFEYPSFIHKISTRVRAFCGVASYPLITGHGRDGVVVSCTFPGGDVHLHKDPRSETGLATLRCNILTRAADAGCILHIDGQPIDVEVGELHCYLVSEHKHFATAVDGATSRVMWMFGAHVPVEDWNSGKIQLGVN